MAGYLRPAFCFKHGLDTDLQGYKNNMSEQSVYSQNQSVLSEQSVLNPKSLCQVRKNPSSAYIKLLVLLEMEEYILSV